MGYAEYASGLAKKSDHLRASRICMHVKYNTFEVITLLACMCEFPFAFMGFGYHLPNNQS